MRAAGAGSGQGPDWANPFPTTSHQSSVPSSGVEPMSLTPTAPGVTGVAGAPPVPRRVRHQARDAVALMVFSAISSTVVAAGLLLLAHLSRAGR